MIGKIDKDARYMASHEWIKPTAGGEFLIGISDHAQDALSDLVYVDLPRVGTRLKAGDVFGVVESVKAASDLYAPLDGTVTKVNTALENDQAIINTDPYGDGWIMQLKADRAEGFATLMDASEYKKLLEETEG